MTVRYEGVEKFSDTIEFEDLDQPVRFWPVVVEVTTTYVLWEEGDTYDEAIDRAKNDPELYEGFRPEAVNGSGWQVIDKPSPWDYEPDHPDQLGPKSRCAECLSVTPYIGFQTHEATCSEFLHRAYVNTAGWGENKGQSRGGCGCTPTMRNDLFPWRATVDEALADVARHVEGKRSEIRR